MQNEQKKWDIDKSSVFSCTPGAVKEGKGIRFSVSAAEGEAAALIFYDKKTKQQVREIEFPSQAAIGNLRTMKITGLAWRQLLYCFRIGEEYVVDPYAVTLFAHTPDSDANEPQVLCGMNFDVYDWQDDRAPRIPYEDAVMYHLHVRNFTKHAKSGVRHKGTFAGLQEKIPYLKELGVNQIKLMPVYEQASAPRLKRQAQQMPADMPGKKNCWGYGAGQYFAVNRHYAATSNAEKELKDMVRAMHTNGIEVLLEMFFLPETPIRTVIDCLTWWVTQYHVDGFHLMGNDQVGHWLKGDPVFAGTKLIVGNVSEEGPSAEQKKSSFRNFAECNDAFLIDIRRILKGDEGILESFAYRTRRNSEAFGVINYITNHDGFTLNDLVSYDNKHNEENGERNEDGAVYNFSWNCGIEGATKRKAVLALRRKQMKNAFLLMLLSQGTPMLLAGDEFCNSQKGNNNPYCLDNTVSWVDWNACARNSQMTEFVKKAIAFRRKHRILHMASEMHMTDYKSYGFPDLSYHSSRAWYGGFEYNSRQLGLLYCGQYAGEEEFLYIAYNLHPLEQELALPKLPEKMVWHVAVDTAKEDSFAAPGETIDASESTHVFPARSITILIGKKEQ